VDQSLTHSLAPSLILLSLTTLTHKPPNPNPNPNPTQPNPTLLNTTALPHSLTHMLRACSRWRSQGPRSLTPSLTHSFSAPYTHSSKNKKGPQPLVLSVQLDRDLIKLLPRSHSRTHSLTGAGATKGKVTFSALLYCTTPLYTTPLHCTPLCTALLHSIALLHFTALHSVLHYSTLHCSTLHCSTLHCSTAPLYNTPLHYSTLHYFTVDRTANACYVLSSHSRNSRIRLHCLLADQGVAQCVFRSALTS
jgi:hypothetical protein